MKYAIIILVQNSIRVDLGQNGGFDTPKQATDHAALLGHTTFSLLPLGGAKEWAAYGKETTPSVAKAIRAKTTTETKVETKVETPAPPAE